MKKLIVNYYNNKPIGVVDLKEMSISQLQEFKATCEKNYKEYCEEQERLDQEKNAIIQELENRIRKIELELAFNRGEITEEEYKNGMAR